MMGRKGADTLTVLGGLKGGTGRREVRLAGRAVATLCSSL